MAINTVDSLLASLKAISEQGYGDLPLVVTSMPDEAWEPIEMICMPPVVTDYEHCDWLPYEWANGETNPRASCVLMVRTTVKSPVRT